VVSLEEAYRLSLQADMWLCPGYCTSRAQLESSHHLFSHFGPLLNGLPIYNNISRINPAGGNDFWESGSVRPDMILEDLKMIFSSCRSSNTLKFNYFIGL
jgi:iron complex transport system substrate-binding protein